MAKQFVNSGDPDQTPRFAASDLGLHCLPITLLRVSRQQWVKGEPGLRIKMAPDEICVRWLMDSHLHVSAFGLTITK